MNTVLIKILQNSVLTQTVLDWLTICPLVGNKFLQCICLWQLVGSRHSYCSNNSLLFSGPPCIFIL